ncbi:MAG: extracellular solute-binding protein [Verrucomicrobiota bacterium]|jgi:spermidine/putrescine transport system substrate-binding protein|nr:extracellular solute-binding protein [Verrucomicrobiota bacterium]
MNTTSFIRYCLLPACLAATVGFAQEPSTNAPVEPPQPKRILRVLNWSDYIDVDDSLPETLPMEQRSPTLQAFAKQYDCTVEYHEYEDFEDFVSQFVNLTEFYDVLVLSCNNAQAIVDMGALMEIPSTKVPNLRYIDEEERTSPPDPEGNYLIPYLSDYTGLLFRSDIINPEDATWANYFNPPERWIGHIGAYDSSAIMFAAAAIANGVKDYSRISTKQVEAARQTLQAFFQKASPALLNYTSTEERLEAKEIWIVPAYSPDANHLLTTHENLQFVIPPEGAEYYRDYLVVPRFTPVPDLALEFINFILNPEVSGRIAAYLGASVPSAEARAVQNRISPPVIPLPVDSEGHLLARMQITYNLHPNLQAYWLEILQQDSPSPPPMDSDPISDVE